MMPVEGSTKIVNFMTPGAGAFVLGHGHIVKMQYFFSFSCLHLGMDQTNLVCSNDVKGRVYRNCKFHDPRGLGSYAKAWSYSGTSKW